MPIEVWGLSAAALSALGFSLKAIFVKLGLAEGADALTLLALRMAFSLPAFLFMAWKTGASGMQRRDFLALGALGFMGYYLASLFDFIGLQFISAGLERIILFTYPTLVLLISAAVLKERLRARALLSLALCYGGIALAMTQDFSLSSSPDTWRGALWVFASALAYAIYWVGSAKVVPRLGSTRLSAYASAFACAFCLGHYALAQPRLLPDVVPKVYLYGLAMALVSTVVPIWLQVEGIRKLGSSKAAIIGTLGPVFTLFFAWLWIDEPLSFAQLSGSALVIGGVVLLGSEKKRPAKA